jgi:uncharacterized membrane protein
MTPLGLLDWVALAVFLLCAVGYPLVADLVPQVRRHSVMAAMDAHRRRWMHAMLRREARIFDAAIVGNLMTSTSFLATSAIFILGGLVAMLGAPELGARVIAELPFASAPDAAIWELKIALVGVIFVAAFFELTWSLRQFNYCSIVIAGVGAPSDSPPPAEQQQAEIAALVANRAARHFNNGLRAYYFGLAAVAWLAHPLALILASLLVLQELHRREFRSAVRAAVMEESAT